MKISEKLYHFTLMMIQILSTGHGTAMSLHSIHKYHSFWEMVLQAKIMKYDQKYPEIYKMKLSGIIYLQKLNRN